MNLQAQHDLSIAGDVVGRDKITINLPPPLPPAEAKDRANLLILLHKVKTFWIEGVLEKSVHNAVLLELGKETKPEAVDHPWEMVLELPDQTNQIIPPGTKIIDIFEKMNRALLILGEPGSGKTITLIELARDLISRAEADPTQPIPVVFNLSSWIDKRQSLHDWLVFELSTKYQIPKCIGYAWLKDNRTLPLFDGLDEVQSEIRASCVEAINHFAETFGLPGRVICCRINEYSALAVRLKLNGAIFLQSLTHTQVDNYLAAGGSNLITLRQALQKDNALQELAQSPLMLSIMSLAYQDLSLKDLTDAVIVTNNDRRKNLFNIYTYSMFKRKGKFERPYSNTQTMHWLSWLAQKMTKHSHAVFLIESMQPNWLQTHWHHSIYSLVMFSIYGIVVGLNSGVFWLAAKELFDIEKVVMKGHGYEMNIWLAASLIWALCIGLVYEFKFKSLEANEISQRAKYLQTAAQIVVHAMTWTFIWILIWLYLGGQNIGLQRLFQPLITGAFVVAILGAWNSSRQSLVNNIQTVEALGWSWAEAKRGAIWGLAGGIALWCIWLLLDALTWEEPFVQYQLFASEWFYRYSLLYWLVGPIVGMIFFGLGSRVLKTKAIPNQGIRLSISNSIIAGFIFGTFTGLPIALIWAAFGRSPKAGLGMGLLYFATAILWYGGWDVLRHFMLRLILHFERNTPRRYAHFLDYAAKLNFLQKVGGGYIFIHRLLLEHFAAMPLQSKTQKE